MKIDWASMWQNISSSFRKESDYRTTELSEERSFKTAFEPAFLGTMSQGVEKYKYRDVGCGKNPLDFALYTKLIWEMKPKTVIEIGTNKGGGVLWIADLLTTYGLDTKLITVDKFDRNEVKDNRIIFLKGDAHHLEQTFSAQYMSSLPKPILVIEDSAHSYASTIAAVNFFDAHLSVGDVLIVEDGILDDSGLSAAYFGGPNRAVAEFLKNTSNKYRIMTEYCDFFGQNATGNPNGYLERVSH